MIAWQSWIYTSVNSLLLTSVINIKLTKAADLESSALLILLTAASTACNPENTHKQLEVNSTLSSQEAFVGTSVYLADIIGNEVITK